MPLAAGLLRRVGAIDVPAGSLAGFEKLFMIASKFAGFHDVEGKYEGQNITSNIAAESILISMESNWIQMKTVIGLIWFVWFVSCVWFLG